jgi:hypothetical protein
VIFNQLGICICVLRAFVDTETAVQSIMLTGRLLVTAAKLPAEPQTLESGVVDYVQWIIGYKPVNFQNLGSDLHFEIKSA